MQYTIVNAHRIELLIEKVEAMIQEGWTPQGGISAANASTIIFAQAMI